MDTRNPTNWGYWIGAAIGIILIVLAFFWWRGDIDGSTGQTSSPTMPSSGTIQPTQPAPSVPGNEQPASSGVND